MDEHANTAVETHFEAPHDKPAMRKRLGRGLNALLGGAVPDSDGNPHDENPVADARATDEISVELLERNPYQPRKEFDQEAILELAESMLTHGVLQPLLVRPHNGSYQIIAGERRWLAAKEAGIETVPCRVMELEDKNVCEVALVENVQRKDLGDLEKAQAFQDYLDRFGGTPAELAKQLGMNRSTVANFVRLLSLPNPVKKALGAGRISNGHARALLSLEETDQIELCKVIQRDSLSVRKTEDSVKTILGRDEAAPDTIPFEQKPEGNHATENSSDTPSETEVTSSAAAEKSNHIVSLEGQLRECLGMKVDIRVSGKDTGKISVEFHNNEEFDMLVKALRTAGENRQPIAEAA